MKNRQTTVSTIVRLGMALFLCTGVALAAEDTAPSTESPSGLFHDFDAGITFLKGDFKWMTWAYGERIFDTGGPDSWRRVRQGMQFNLPRVTSYLRPAFVYEIDLTNTDFFKIAPPRRIFENLYLALQNADDQSQFRVLIGENTHILSREDNLSSGNLPTVNRALILEEHGSVKAFGTQFGIQAQRQITDKVGIAFSAQDNRGSLNQEVPRYIVGNSLAAKVSGTLMKAASGPDKLSYGLGIDRTGGYDLQTFSLTSALGGASFGGASVGGTKWTAETDLTWVSSLGSMAYSLEWEGMSSTFSGTATNVSGGFLQAQVSLWDTRSAGELTPFLRHDFVILGQEGLTSNAIQQAARAGFNYNLPYLQKLMNLHAEYAHNEIHGPSSLVSQAGVLNEFRLELRFSLTRYNRF